MKKRSDKPNESELRNRWADPQPRSCGLRCLGAVAGMALMLSGSSALAQFKLDVAPEYFYWQEDVNGAKVMDNSGFRIGLEASYEQPKEKGWLSATRFKLYYGEVDYDGQTWGGTPLKTTTDYYGGLLEERYGYRWGLGEKQYLDLMGGIGLDFWLRSLNGPGGYNEYWLPIYLKAGLEVSPKETGWIGTLGVKAAVYTTQIADFGRMGGGTVTVHPGTMPSGYAEAGYKFTKNLSAAVFFDSYWFSKSSMESGVYQPESKSYEVGVKVGWTF